MKHLLFLAFLTTGQYLPEADQQTLRRSWPTAVPFPTGGLFYDHAPAYQDDGLHSPSYNIAARPDPFGNANMEFPWRTPAGLHQSTGWKSYKLAAIPGPIKWWREQKSPFANESPAIHWEYPQGTTFAEALFLKCHDGYDRVFEVRIRTKNNNLWEPSIYRPFASLDELPVMAKKSVRKVRGFGVDADVELHEIPYLDPAIWLNNPFKRSKLAMTSKVDSIVPKGYLGNITKCVDCHKQTGLHSRTIDANRDWYGNVRGSDQIFSFSIFDESSISHDGASRPIRFHPKLSLERKDR